LSLTNPSGELEARIEFSKGQRVRICAGPFADQLGKVDELKPRERVRVLLAMMSGEVTVEIDRGDLWPADGAT